MPHNSIGCGVAGCCTVYVGVHDMLLASLKVRYEGKASLRYDVIQCLGTGEADVSVWGTSSGHLAEQPTEVKSHLAPSDGGRVPVMST